jgi:methylmalonyl-CoA/ethylmalonyl-CoA epimerase
MKKIEHLGIAVKDLEESEKMYTAIFGVKPYKREEVLSQKVITSFFRVGPNKIELVQATDPSSPIARYIEKRGEGIHHVAYDVTDIVLELKKLSDQGFQLINEKPVNGADNKLIAFVHPKSTGGALIELCQERPELK